MVEQKIKEQEKIDVPFFEFSHLPIERVQKTGQDTIFNFAKTFAIFEVIAKNRVKKTLPLRMHLQAGGTSYALETN